MRTFDCLYRACAGDSSKRALERERSPLQNIGRRRYSSLPPSVLGKRNTYYMQHYNAVIADRPIETLFNTSTNVRARTTTLYPCLPDIIRTRSCHSYRQNTGQRSFPPRCQTLR